jgi:hypothetical protein
MLIVLFFILFIVKSKKITLKNSEALDIAQFISSLKEKHLEIDLDVGEYLTNSVVIDGLKIFLKKDYFYKRKGFDNSWERC